jgi:peptidylprolyl isomerase
MAEKIAKRDFIEIYFTARDLASGNVFDTNIKEEADKAGLKIKIEPLIISAGENMVIEGFDESLIGKELGTEYKVKISPEKAFGPRKKELVRLLPIKLFLEKKVYPRAGDVYALDSSLVKITSVSGGRVLADFNNPLAGKELEYTFKAVSKITDDKRKVEAIIKSYTGMNLDFKIEPENKKIIFHDLKLMQVVNMLKDKIKLLVGYDSEILETKEKKEEIKK